MGRPRKTKTPLKREWSLNDGTKITVEGQSSVNIQATSETFSVSMNQQRVMPAREFGEPIPVAPAVYTRGKTAGLGADRPSIIPYAKVRDAQAEELSDVGLDLEDLDKMAGGV